MTLIRRPEIFVISTKRKDEAHELQRYGRKHAMQRIPI